MKTLLLLTILLLFQALPAAAQAKEPEGRAPRLSVTTDKGQYFVGEPVELILTLKNERGEKLNGTLKMGFELNNLRVRYGRLGQRPTPFVSTEVNANATSNVTVLPEDLPAGGSAVHRERLLYAASPSGLLLSEPGEYEFQATFYYQDEVGDTIPLESNTAHVVVRAPPEAEGEALAAWNDAELLDFLQGNDGYVAEAKVKAGMRKAVNFIQGHGGSVYAAAARKGLLDYLTPRAEANKLTPEEKAVFESLSGEQ